LATYPYTPSLGLPEAAYCLLAAKFAAEAAEGVGEETYVSVLAPSQDLFSFVLTTTTDSVREKWRNLPRIPEGAADEIREDLEKYEAFMHKVRYRAKQGKKTVLADLAGKEQPKLSDSQT